MKLWAWKSIFFVCSKLSFHAGFELDKWDKQSKGRENVGLIQDFVVICYFSGGSANYAQMQIAGLTSLSLADDR